MHNKRILVVEDELDMRIFISTLLKTNGYEPIVAVNGDEGINKARKSKPAAIIMDVMMPKAGGIQMYREIKTDQELKDIPVIMLSAIAQKTFYHSLRMLNTYRGQTVPEPDAYVERWFLTCLCVTEIDSDQQIIGIGLPELDYLPRYLHFTLGQMPGTALTFIRKQEPHQRHIEISEIR